MKVIFFMRQREASVLVDASVEYTDGQVLSWKVKRDLIFDRGRAGCFPRFLRLSGPTLDIHISADGCFTDKNGVTKMIRGHVRNLRPFWREAVAYTRQTYSISETLDTPLPFTLLELQQDYITGCHDYMVLYRPAGSLHFDRVDTIKYKQPELLLESSQEAQDYWITREVRIG